MGGAEQQKEKARTTRKREDEEVAEDEMKTENPGIIYEDEKSKAHAIFVRRR